MELRNFVNRDGHDLFDAWFKTLDPMAKAKVAVQLVRMKNGNFSNVKSVGGGALEKKIDWGPGYRIYFGKVGNALIILLGGGSKARQSRDIADAHERWEDYCRRRKG